MGPHVGTAAATAQTPLLHGTAQARSNVSAAVERTTRSAVPTHSSADGRIELKSTLWWSASSVPSVVESSEWIRIGSHVASAA